MPELNAGSVAAIGRIGIVPTLLDICCRITGMRFAAVARVTEDRWIACATDDRIGFGLAPGSELEVQTTLCNEIRDHGRTIVIDDAAADPVYSEHHTPRVYGLKSYISVPILRGDGSFWGTLCAIDPEPHNVSDPVVTGTFKVFAELIAMHLDTQARLEMSEAALEQERDTATLRDRFIAVLGHDLRNPLAAVEAGTRLLGSSALDARQEVIVRQMAASTRRMSQLVDDMLDLARGRLGGGLALERADDRTLADDIAQVIEELRAVHPQRELDVDIDIAGSVPCDHRRMMQLLSNLLANSLMHGDPDMPVRVSARLEGSTFRIEVANGGKPIPKAKLVQLFQPFTSSGRNPNKGLGLGLFIAMEIARAHGGTIDVVSEPGETRFRFTMPCEVMAAVD